MRDGWMVRGSRSNRVPCCVDALLRSGLRVTGHPSMGALRQPVEKSC
jgi:hypothetical protein